MKLVIHPEALIEVREGARYYKDVSRALANDFLAEVETMCWIWLRTTR